MFLSLSLSSFRYKSTSGFMINTDCLTFFSHFFGQIAIEIYFFILYVATVLFVAKRIHLDLIYFIPLSPTVISLFLFCFSSLSTFCATFFFSFHCHCVIRPFRNDYRLQKFSRSVLYGFHFCSILSFFFINFIFLDYCLHHSLFRFSALVIHLLHNIKY